jgi:hypothetical protein
MKHRDPYAKELREPKYRQRIVPDIKKYSREKEKRKLFDDQEEYVVPGN